MAGLLTAVGVTEIYRLGPDDAFKQGLWIVIGVALFALALFGLRRDYRVLEQYKYLFGIGAIVLLFLPRVPGIGTTVNGARLWVHVGPLAFQPGELSKIFLIVFLAAYLREKREVLAQARLEGRRPAARDLGRAACSCSSRRTTSARGFSTSGSSWRCSTSRPRASRSCSSGSALFLAGGFVAYEKIAHVHERVDDLAAPVDDRQGVLPVDRRARAAPGLRELPARASRSTRSANGGFGGAGLGKGTFTTTDGHALIPFVNTRLHLLGARAGARADRRRRAAARLHALRRARHEDRAAGRRRLLEAARRRPDVRLRAADVHHRRRRAAADPADRDHAAVRLVRRLVGGRELRAARGPARSSPTGRTPTHEQADLPRRARRAAAARRR